MAKKNIMGVYDGQNTGNPDDQYAAIANLKELKAARIAATTPAVVKPSAAPVTPAVPYVGALAPVVKPPVKAPVAAPVIDQFADPTTSAVGPVRPTKGIMKRGVIQPRGDLRDPIATKAWNRQTEDRAGDQQMLGGDQNSGYVGQAFSNVPGTPGMRPVPGAIGVATTNEAISGITRPGYTDQKPAYDQAGIEAAKNDIARQVAFVPGQRDGYRTSDRGAYFNLRPRKGVEEANAAAQGAIGAIHANRPYDERIAKNATEAARSNADAARVDAGLDRTSKENIEKGKNEAVVTVGLAKNMTYKDQLKQRMNTTAFMAQMQQLRDAAKNAVTDADKLAIQQHEDELVQSFQTASQAAAQPTAPAEKRYTPQEAATLPKGSTYVGTDGVKRQI